MELRVQLEEVVDPVELHRRGLALDELVDVRQVLAGQERDGEPDGERLERLPHLVRLEELLVASAETTAPRRGADDTSPSAARRPRASRTGPG